MQFFSESRSVEKSLYMSLHQMDWLSAQLTCKNLGMQLLTPENEEDDKALRKVLNSFESVHIGASSMGTDGVWYAIGTGKVFDYDFDWKTVVDKHPKTTAYIRYDDRPTLEPCLRLVRQERSKILRYADIKCTGVEADFICEKIHLPFASE